MSTLHLNRNRAAITVGILLVVFVSYHLAVPGTPPVLVAAPKPAAHTDPNAMTLAMPDGAPIPISSSVPAPTENPIAPLKVEPLPPPPDPLLAVHQKDLDDIKSLQDQIGGLKGLLADANDKAAMWQSILVQQDTLLDVFSTALPDLPVYRQNVYVVISLPQGTFNFNSTKLSDASQRRLALIAKIFNRYDGIFYLGIEGHTDNVPVKAGGKYADNVAIGMARANRAYQVLLQAGVAPEKMAVISWGAALPAVAHAKQQADPANRRVELVFAPQRAIEHPEPVASLLTPDVRARLRAYSESFLQNRGMLHLGPSGQLEPPPQPQPPQTAYTLRQ